MEYRICIADKTNRYEHVYLKFENYNDGKKHVYIDVQTADGYTIHEELPDSKKALIMSMLLTSLTGNSLDRLCEIANKCRGENDNTNISSMLGEIESTLTDIAAQSVDCIITDG